jgi:hypothetical protein
MFRFGQLLQRGVNLHSTCGGAGNDLAINLSPVGCTTRWNRLCRRQRASSYTGSTDVVYSRCD